MKYKYTIHVRLRNLPVNDYEIAMKQLPELCGIHKQTFRNWIYIDRNDSKDIPATALVKIAAFFQCKPEELFSEPPVQQSLENFKNELKN